MSVRKKVNFDVFLRSKNVFTEFVNNLLPSGPTNFRFPLSLVDYFPGCIFDETLSGS